MAVDRYLFTVAFLIAMASASPIKEVVSSCSAITSAFSRLQGQFVNATRPSTLRMTLTLNCSADWSGCGTSGNFAPRGPANSAKQPKVVIDIKTDCKRGQNITIKPNGQLFAISAQASNATAVVSISGPLTVQDGGLISASCTADTGCSLSVKDVSSNDSFFVIGASFLDRVSVTRGQFGRGAMSVSGTGITKSFAVTKSTFEGFGMFAIGLQAPPSDTKVLITGNSFKNAAPNGLAVYVSELEGRMNIDLRKTTVDNTSSNPICIDSLVNITAAKINVAGSVGFTPTKANKTLTPAGWPTSEDCTIAEFFAV